jgi:hypothetical protein
LLKKSKRLKIKKKDVLSSSKQRRRIYHTYLIKNKAESIAFKKHKMEESFTSNNNILKSIAISILFLNYIKKTFNNYFTINILYKLSSFI